MRWCKFIPFVMAFYTTVLGQNSEICNTIEGIYSPCRCNPHGFYSLVCENVTNLNTMMDFLERASEENLLEVSIRHSVIHTLPLEKLSFLGYIFINLKDVSLTMLFDNTPESRINFEQLHLDSINVQVNWTWEPLSSFMNLKRLSIINIPLEFIDEQLITHVSSTLQSLTVTSTGTKRISSTGFAKFDNLIYVSVQNNDIEELQRSMFPTLSRIKYFYFGKNKISHLPEDIFSNMPELRRVGLQDNAISEINILTFGKVWSNLSALFLAGNPIKCQCNVSWITSVQCPSTLTGRCRSPKDKYGKKLSTLTRYDFFC